MANKRGARHDKGEEDMRLHGSAALALAACIGSGTALAADDGF